MQSMCCPELISAMLLDVSFLLGDKFQSWNCQQYLTCTGKVLEHMHSNQGLAKTCWKIDDSVARDRPASTLVPVFPFFFSLV